MVDTTLAAIQRHPEYFLIGGDLYFLIENSLFRVHRYFFERESHFFEEQLATPAAPGEPAKGGSESSALVFDDVKSVDFERLLWVFYNPTYSIYNATVEEWTSILCLSHRWVFGEVKALAVRQLEKIPMSDVERIVLYHKFEVEKTILIPRYAALCAREYHLTNEEGKQLGLETSLLIARARECARCKMTSGEATPVPKDFKEEDMDALIKDLFGLRESPPSPTPYTSNGQHKDPSGPKAKANINTAINGHDGAKTGPAGKDKHNDGSGPSNPGGRSGGKDKDKGKDKDRKKPNTRGHDANPDADPSTSLNGAADQ